MLLSSSLGLCLKVYYLSLSLFWESDFNRSWWAWIQTEQAQIPSLTAMLNRKEHIKLSGHFTERSVLAFKKKRNISSGRLEGFISFVCLIKSCLVILLKDNLAIENTACSMKLCINKYWFALDWTLVAERQSYGPNSPIDSG